MWNRGLLFVDYSRNEVYPYFAMTAPTWVGSFVLGLLFATSATAEVKQTAYSFPENPDTPVLKVEEFFLEKGSETPPLVLVYADGRVVKQVSEKREDDYVISIGKDGLNQLLKGIIEENKFFDIDVEDIKNEVLSERKRKRLLSSYEFRVELNLGDRSHVVSLGDSWVYQRLVRGRAKHPEAKVFHRFLNVEELCRKLSRWTLVGGEAEMEAILKSANEHVQKSFPGSPAISEADILSLKPKEGRAVMRLGVKEGVGNPTLHVIVEKTKGAEGFEVQIQIKKPQPFHGGKPPLRML